ncbi:MAG: hypothetical protein IPN38_14560, partial [Flavobacteriales bacterium]|nr:hypothetical protein [Flavobacteriales bacterium]
MDDGAALLLIVALALIIWMGLRLRRTVRERDRILREKEEMTRAMVDLEAENALLETEHLKFQLQPHTLNNILANLKTIATKLSRGMDALSSTLDYILYKGRTHLVCVE